MATTLNSVTTAADLLTSGWIREQYRGRVQYPVTIKSVSAMFLKRVTEEWESKDDCIALSKCDKNKTATRICTTLLSDATVRGSIGASTRGGHHEWKLRFNNIEEGVTIGICDEAQSTPMGNRSIEIHYGIRFDKRFRSFKVFSRTPRRRFVHSRTYCINEPISNGDLATIRIRGNNVEFEVDNNEIRAPLPSIQIRDGNYTIFCFLELMCDSISIISYSQTDKVKPKCTGKRDSRWCEQELQIKWNYCPKCRTKI